MPPLAGARPRASAHSGQATLSVTRIGFRASATLVGCSFSSTETKNEAEMDKFINSPGHFNEFTENLCQEDYHKNIVNQLNKKLSVDNSAKL